MAQESDCQIDSFFQDEFDVGTVEGNDYSIFIIVSNNLSNHSAEKWMIDRSIALKRFLLSLQEIQKCYLLFVIIPLFDDNND